MEVPFSGKIPDPDEGRKLRYLRSSAGIQKQSGKESTEMERVSTKAMPLLRAQQSWQGGTWAECCQISCFQEKQKIWFLGKFLWFFFKHWILKIKSIIGLRGPSFQPLPSSIRKVLHNKQLWMVVMTSEHEQELHRQETGRKTHPRDAPQGKTIEKVLPFHPEHSLGRRRCFLVSRTWENSQNWISPSPSPPCLSPVLAEKVFRSSSPEYPTLNHQQSSGVEKLKAGSILY